METQKHLIELRNIGKIYVSEGNVSVGIRGVNLSFDKGEFVAVTGKSGSGKSTLLNVISGMDTYEEGELLIEGEQTSHYIQKDWEEYRKRYISFIFQNYNILDSFTVLQNVELALLHIENAVERRERALELIRRVGLEKQINSKGSKLSGGQKQRTVIARALAKDSPIILADEPTGNLDSQTSKEIINLLREVSKDKLVIIVTHNFDEVEAYATRHVRIFDGAVESDHVLSAPAPVTTYAQEDDGFKKPSRLRNFANGVRLGHARFWARPKLSIFLCILLTLTAMIIVAVTALAGDISEVFEDEKELFTHIDGRVIIVREDGAVPGDDEIQSLRKKTGAESSVRFDYMLDSSYMCFLDGINDKGQYESQVGQFAFAYIGDRGVGCAGNVKPDVGRLPEKDNEVLLIAPVYFKPLLEAGGSFTDYDFVGIFEKTTITAVGVSYYYDNTRDPVMVFTESGYKIASALAFMKNAGNNVSVNVVSAYKGKDWFNENFTLNYFLVDYSMEPGTYTVTGLTDIAKKTYNQTVAPSDLTVRAQMSGSFTTYRYGNYGNDGNYGYKYYDIEPVAYVQYGDRDTVVLPFDEYRFVSETTVSQKRMLLNIANTDVAVFVSPDIAERFITEKYCEASYTQASLFYANDREAKAAISELEEKGYTAVLSNVEAKPSMEEKLLGVLAAYSSLSTWVFTIAFATLFLILCSSKAMQATRGDVGIMRSMGIETGVIKTGIRVQTFIALIPAVVITAIGCVLIYTSPRANQIFSFLHAIEYIEIFAVLFLICLFLAKHYVRKMFGQSVKKTLRGGGKV